jgi:hypothetical protein
MHASYMMHGRLSPNYHASHVMHRTVNVLIRLIFSFTLVCITHQWQKYVYLTAYFISFTPLMATFPIFVLPAKIYKTEFNTVIEQTIRKWRAMWI